VQILCGPEGNSARAALESGVVDFMEFGASSRDNIATSVSGP
jgi:hypothetical protein